MFLLLLVACFKRLANHAWWKNKRSRPRGVNGNFVYINVFILPTGNPIQFLFVRSMITPDRLKKLKSHIQKGGWLIFWKGEKPQKGGVKSCYQLWVNTISNYSVRNSLTIHPEQCKIFIIKRSKFFGPLPPAIINDKSMK